MPFRKWQLIALLGAFALIVIIYFLPRNPAVEHVPANPGSGNAANAMELLSHADSLLQVYSFTRDSATQIRIGLEAVKAYEAVLEKDPSSQDAKAGLGFCIAGTSAEPMKGITMLREVATANPQHERTQYFLGLLSIRSGQFEKAVTRFENVRQINSENINVLLPLGQSYLQLGNREKAREALTLLKDKTNDPELKAEAERLLTETSN